MTKITMNKTESSIFKGLQDALSYAQGDQSRGKTYNIEVDDIDVKQTRKKLGLSQGKFATTFGVSVATVRNWEQGRRKPVGAARVLLKVIENEPDAVFRALQA